METDKRTIYTPGWKYNHWELKGVPIRMELGPRDVKNNTTILVRRDNGEKITMSMDDLSAKLPALLETIQNDMFRDAKAKSDALLARCSNWADFMKELNSRKRVLVPFCQVGKNDWSFLQRMSKCVCVCVSVEGLRKGHR